MAGPSRSKEKPIEYWISRSTDPYLDEDTRKKYINTLCERVNTELDGAYIATGVLSHKVVSPDQDEALHSLKVVDQLVRQCGEKVHVRVGKFRFLNQLVKILTPKYLGERTSPEVKTETIRLLYTWQRSMKQVEKFKEVYDTLKQHKLIAEDPVIPEEQLAIARDHSPKLAVFEDAENSKLLHELLRSSKQQDLEAANRLIKTLVKCDEKRVEKEHSRVRDLCKARDLCAKLAYTLTIGDMLGDNAVLDTEGAKKAYGDLLDFRPILFKYASEAAEENSENLKDIIDVVEEVNKLLQKYRGFQDLDKLRHQNEGSEEECTDLLGDQLSTGGLIETKKCEAAIDSELDSLKTDLGESKALSDHGSESADVPFIGFDRIMTPALPRRQPKVKRESLTDKINGSTDPFIQLDDLMQFNHTHRASFHSPKPSLNELVASKEIEHHVDNLMTLTDDLLVRPQFVQFDYATVKIDGHFPPIVVLDKMNIVIRAYRVQMDNSNSQNSFILSVSNNNPNDVETCYLSVTTSNLNVHLKLHDPSPFSLRAFHPSRGIDSQNRQMSIIPIKNIPEIDIDFSVFFNLDCERTISGMFTLPITEKNENNQD